MTLLQYFSAAILATQSTPDSVTVAVYAAVLDSFFVRPGIQRLVIVPITAAGHGHVDDLDYQNGLKGLAPLPAGLQTSFEQERRRRVPIPVSSLPTRVPSVPFTDADATALPHTNPTSYWEAFYRRGGEVQLAASRCGACGSGMCRWIILSAPFAVEVS